MAKMQVLLILSGWVEKDRLDEETIKRCDMALMKWRTGFYDAIIVSGGMFRKGQTMPAASMMHYYLITHGVEPRKIFPEKTSVDTYENIINTLVMWGYNIGSLRDIRFTIITNPFHGLRAKAIFLRNWGWRNNHLSPAWYWPGLKAVIMEIGLTLLVLTVDPKCRVLDPVRRQRRINAALSI
jgi:vancomycin permeability regulator SanA